MADDDREIPALVRELVTLSRRFRANAERLHPDLSFVEYSLLSEMAERGGARARDLVGLYGINKSTISRQVAALQQAGLVVRETDPDHARGQLLHPSDRGRELLAHADTLMHREVATRTGAWTPEEVSTLCGLLARYNAASSAATEDTRS
ncbi:MarR family winged helix-turn-helix transcriptional regulator [Streptomyces sp. NPDC059900]|uniref:MarR family winged helix-turn-helix transcriptional regulator n=1 Tax=Streptomyces sp. NPDC059900 TaxID=3155816 RepID=UPI00342080A9